MMKLTTMSCNSTKKFNYSVKTQNAVTWKLKIPVTTAALYDFGGFLVRCSLPYFFGFLTPYVQAMLDVGKRCGSRTTDGQIQPNKYGESIK